MARILIVGAGIAGLAIARALQMRGIDVDIVEREAPSTQKGHGILLLGNAMHALDSMGLKEQILSVSFPIRSQTVLSARGSVLNRIDTGTVWGRYGPCVSMLRRDLLGILLGSVGENRILYNTAVTQAVSQSNKREVYFSDGRVSDYDLVIGADGIHSSVRESAFGKIATRSLGVCAWRLSVDVDHDLTGWTAMMTKGRTLLAIPLGSTGLSLYADCPVHQFGEGSIMDLKRAFADFTNPLGSIVSCLPENAVVHRAHLQEVRVAKFVSDRVALIGEAAHACSTSLAQGAGMAIEDATVLADCVADFGATDRALDNFYTLRKERAESIRRQCQACEKLRFAPDLVRDLMLRTIGRHLYRRTYGPLFAAL